MAKEDELNLGSGEGFGLIPGQTHELLREEFLREEPTGSPDEQALINFLKVIAEDSNIEGVAISKINYGGIYTTWFVKNYLDQEKTRNTLHVTSRSYDFLRAAAHDNTGYGSFISLGDRTFEEIESYYRASWGVKDEERFPFDYGASHNEGLELIGIFRFR